MGEVLVIKNTPESRQTENFKVFVITSVSFLKLKKIVFIYIFNIYMFRIAV